jgi:signal transduction histidine kinase
LAAFSHYKPIPVPGPAGPSNGVAEDARAWNQGVRLEALANLAHELRTPVQVLLGYLEILRDDLQHELNGEAAEIIERMNANVHDLAQTVENLLQFGTAGGGQTRAEEVFPVGELLDELMPVLEAANRDKGLDIELVAAGGPEIIGCPRKPLRVILLNLASNAVKFTGSGKVTISVSEGRAPDGAEAVVLEVTDTGPGMEPELIERAFESLNQLSNSSARRFRGLGLGLSVVHQNVGALGGTIEVQTTPSHGSSFRTTIPCRIVRRFGSNSFNRKLQSAAKIADAAQIHVGSAKSGRRIHHS